MGQKVYQAVVARAVQTSMARISTSPAPQLNCFTEGYRLKAIELRVNEMVQGAGATRL
jgi:hypothetical protein